MGRDTTRAAVVAAQCAAEPGLFYGEDWVALASQLVAEGEESPETVALASAGPSLAPSEIDVLIADVVEAHCSEIGDPITVAELLISTVAAEVAARPPSIDYPMVRFVASLAWRVDAPVVWECLSAAEYLDCDCHTGADAARLEPLLCARARTDLSDRLIQILGAVARRALFGNGLPMGH